MKGRQPVIAVVGSRRGIFYNEVANFIKQLPKYVKIISGGAIGVDTWAKQAALNEGFTFEEYPADWKKYGRSAGFIRNNTLVNEADIVVAFWHEKSPGTADTLQKASVKGIPTYVDPVYMSEELRLQLAAIQWPITKIKRKEKS